jgi:hypothetical protein
VEGDEAKGPDPFGKRSLFWAPAERCEEPDEEAGSGGREALFSSWRAPGPASGDTVRSGLLPPVTMECSSCATRSELDVLHFLSLHLPVWWWRPGRGYTRWMRCPACDARTWVSASWPATGPR